MYQVWTLGIHPQSTDNEPPPPPPSLLHRTSPTKKKKNHDLEYTSQKNKRTSVLTPTVWSCFQTASPFPTPSSLFPLPHASLPSQDRSEKHRGGRSPQITPSQIPQQSQVTSSNYAAILLYETSRHYLTLSHTHHSCCSQADKSLVSQLRDCNCCCHEALLSSSYCDNKGKTSVHFKRGHRSDVTYSIRGCNIVQIMSPSPSSFTSPAVDETAEIRSNSPPSFCSANVSPSSPSCRRSNASPTTPTSPIHSHYDSDRHPSPHMNVEDANALKCEFSTGERRACKSTSRSISNSSSSPSQNVFLLMILCLLLAGGADSSELPDRECCDSVPPPPPNYHHATSTTTTTTTPTPKADFNTSISITSYSNGGVMNCIAARHECIKDKGCNDVLQLMHKICGPELVACSSTTPKKCQMLLRTLRNFDYLNKCECSEAHIDYTCHNFREMIFSHPCSMVEVDDYSNYSPQTIPHCSEAYKQCKAKSSCLRDYISFESQCNSNGITCLSQESEKCMETWTKIRQTPMFGCKCSRPGPVRALPYGSRVESSLSRYNTRLDENEECMKIYNSTHENPCLAGQHDVSKATMVDPSQATCHKALENCQSDEECAALLKDVLVWCAHAHCEPERCRIALQEFYDRVSIIHRLQVAFCVCRQSDPDGECLTAMRKLHPTCAERHSGRDPMKCHKIAEHCRESPMCRDKLRDYEQKCAADAMTGRCADTHRSCQKAVMNILGTELHATCVCKGTDFLHQHDCYTWQKLLWSNPCVIESHLKLHQEIADGTPEDLDEVFRRPAQRTTPPPVPQFVDPTPEEEDSYNPGNGEYGIIVDGPTFTGAETPYLRGFGRPSPDRDNSQGGGQDYGSPVIPGSEYPKPKWRDNGSRGGGLNVGRNNGRNGSGGRTGIQIGNTRNVGRTRPRFGEKPDHIGRGGVYNGRNLPRNGHEVEKGGHRGTDIPGWNIGPRRKPDSVYRIGNERRPSKLPTRFDAVTPPPVGGMTPPPPTPTPVVNVTEIPPVTVPVRTCRIQNVIKEKITTQEIPEGNRRRIYNSSDCSSICECRPTIMNRMSKLTASCTTLGCIQRTGCQTGTAKFPHASPYYQAYRGDCDCYDGNFICQKPDPSNYTLSPGVYMFLGYSKGEMKILKPVTLKNELDAIDQMEHILIRDYGFKCTLKIEKHIGENFIAIAQLKVDPDQYMNAFIRQRREKEECAKPLEYLAEKINSRPRHSDILTDAHLSMFILAEVDVTYPEAQTSPASASCLMSPCTNYLTYVVTLLAAILLHHCYFVDAMVAPIGIHLT